MELKKLKLGSENPDRILSANSSQLDSTLLRIDMKNFFLDFDPGNILWTYILYYLKDKLNYY